MIYIVITQLIKFQIKLYEVHFLKYLRYFDLSNESFNSSSILIFCFGFLASILRLRSSLDMVFMSRGNCKQNIEIVQIFGYLRNYLIKLYIIHFDYKTRIIESNSKARTIRLNNFGKVVKWINVSMDFSYRS